MHRIDEEYLSVFSFKVLLLRILATFPKSEVCASVESACSRYPHCMNVANDDNIDLSG